MQIDAKLNSADIIQVGLGNKINQRFGFFLARSHGM